MRKRSLVWALAAVAVFVAAGQLYAGSVLVRQSGYLHYGYGNSDWDNMTAAMDAACDSIAVTPNLLDLGAMLSYDALWVDLIGSTSATLGAAEINNIAAYIATGRRVAVIGENAYWTAWNTQIMGLVGGSYAGGEFSGTANSALVHELTAGVASIQVPTAGVAVGGTALFDVNLATLWHGDTVLTLLDVNVTSDGYWGSQSNAQFGENMAEWIAGGGGPGPDIPEPTTLVLMGLAGVGLAIRKRLIG